MSRARPMVDRAAAVAPARGAAGCEDARDSIPALLVDAGATLAALPVSAVEEVLPAAWLSPPPFPAAGLDGLLDVSGALLPVFDLGVLLGHPPTPFRDSDHFVRLHPIDGRALVLRVVEAVRVAAAEPVDDRAEGGSGSAAGLVRVGAQVVCLLDPKRVTGAAGLRGGDPS